ncbi:reverse transcriptase domain-containing protein, partial [Tanacetum coccineum]
HQATRNWSDDLDPKSVDSFEELSQKFLKEFSQHKRYAKDPTEIHSIKRRQNEDLQAFMDQFKSKSSQIKGVPPVLCISAFMHDHGHPELAKKLNDKIPKTVDKMFERVSAFIRGEVVAGSAEMAHPFQWDKGNGSQHQRLLLVKKANRGSCGLGEVGSPGEGNLSKQPEERESWKEQHELTFPVIPQNQLTDKPIILEGMIEGRQVRRILVNGGSFSRQTYHPLGIIDLRVTMGKAGRNKTVLMEFAIIKCRSPYNVIIGRTEKRSLRATTGKGASSGHGPNQGLVPLEKTWDKENTEEVFTISQERPNQYVTIRTTLTADCKRLLTEVLREIIEPVVHKRRPLTPDERHALKERVFGWLKERTIKKVQHPEWVANMRPIKLANRTWKVQVDYSSLNKVCAKDIQIRMAKNDEEKTRFHTEEGVYCFTHMPKRKPGFGGDTLKDDGKGLDQSKRAKCRSIPGRNSGEKQKRTQLSSRHRRNTQKVKKSEHQN